MKHNVPVKRIRPIAIWLLGILTAMLFANPAFTLMDRPHDASMAVEHGQSSGCPDHAPASPSPAPASNHYLCCASGHNVAVPAAGFPGRSSLAFADFISIETQSSPLTLHAAVSTDAQDFLSGGSSPGFQPLRV